VATEVTLRDGTPAITWPLLPSDREALAQGYERLDPESKYQRFLTAVPHLSTALLDHLVDEVDGVDHVALVIFLFDEDSVGEPAGIGRIVRYPDDPTAADVAVTVGPQFRGRGVAGALLDRLLAERPAGVTRIVTQVAADNAPSLRMLQRLGPTTLTPVEDGVVGVTVELPPGPTARPDAGRDAGA
jgi:RimJ/RimL family protein N-acetyltransferase